MWRMHGRASVHRRRLDNQRDSPAISPDQEARLLARVHSATPPTASAMWALDLRALGPISPGDFQLGHERSDSVLISLPPGRLRGGQALGTGDQPLAGHPARLPWKEGVLAAFGWR